MRDLAALVLAVLTLLAAPADARPDASSAKQEPPAPGTPPQPARSRPEDLAALVRGNSDFAFDLYRSVRSDGENLFFSPHSISAALAMTYAGARGDTERAMAGTLRFGLPDARLHGAFNALDQALAGRASPGGGEVGCQLCIANSLWAQRGHPFLSSFLDTLGANYGAGVRPCDFVADAETSRQRINEWVEGETRGRIVDLVPSGVLNGLTRMVLVNAIYFKGSWAREFPAGATSPDAFHGLDGREARVPFMHQTENLRTAQGDGFLAVELPYEGNEISLLALLPDAGTLDRLDARLSGTLVDETVGRLRGEYVQLAMPRFTLRTSLRLSDALSALGMGLAFTADADFSGMDGTEDLFIADVIHQAFVAVDEQGTEAAAATAVVMEGECTSVPPPPRPIALDRPFVFLIRDNPTGAVLFAGRVLMPE